MLLRHEAGILLFDAVLGSESLVFRHIKQMIVFASKETVRHLGGETRKLNNYFPHSCIINGSNHDYKIAMFKQTL